MTLKEYLNQGPRGTKAAFAAKLGIGLPYLSQLQGGRLPTMALAIRIKRETGGAVTLDDWDTEK